MSDHGVFLVDDQMLVRTGFGMLIKAQDDLRWSARPATVLEAVAALAPGRRRRRRADGRPDAGMDGVEATRRIRPRGIRPGCWC